MYKKELSVKINWHALKELRESMWYTQQSFWGLIWLTKQTIHNMESSDNYTVFRSTYSQLEKLCLGWNIWPFVVKPLNKDKKTELFKKIKID